MRIKFVFCFAMLAPLGLLAQPLPQVSAACTTPAIHVVVKGDTLSGISLQEYGTWRLYAFIADAQSKKILEPYVIYPGQKLLIPCCVPQVELARMRKLQPPPQPHTAVRVQRRSVVAVAPPPPAEPPVSAPPPPPVQQPPAPAPQPAPAAPPAQVVVNVQQTQTVTVNKEPPVPVPPPPVPPPPVPVPPVPKPPTVPMPTVKVDVMYVAPPKIFPGTAWNSALTTPLEKGNFLNYSHFDQGFTLWQSGSFQVQPYVALNTTISTKPYSWDNRAEVEGGVKLLQSFRHGLVDLRLAYGYETRRGGMSKSAPIVAIDDWFGWGQPSSSSKRQSFLSAFPGSTWMTIGYNVSPFERGNVIGLAKVEQGAVVAKVGKVRVIPDIWAIVGADSKKEFWNNRYTVGGGLKLAVPWKVLAFDVTGGWERASQYRGIPNGLSAASGFVVKINLWTGWRLHEGGR